MSTISTQKRSSILSKEITKYIKQGFKLIDKNDINYNAILHRDAEKTNHLLHLILTIVTCFLWVIIWGGKSALNKPAKTINIFVDESGTVFIS